MLNFGSAPMGGVSTQPFNPTPELSNPTFGPIQPQAEPAFVQTVFGGPPQVQETFPAFPPPSFPPPVNDANMYLSGVAASVQYGRIPSLNALVSGFPPNEVGTPQGQAIQNQVQFMLSGMGPQGQLHNEQFQSAMSIQHLDRLQGELGAASLNTYPDSLEAQSIEGQMHMVQNMRFDSVNRLNHALMQDPAQGMEVLPPPPPQPSFGFGQGFNFDASGQSAFAQSMSGVNNFFLRMTGSIFGM